MFLTRCGDVRVLLELSIESKSRLTCSHEHLRCPGDDVRGPDDVRGADDVRLHVRRVLRRVLPRHVRHVRSCKLYCISVLIFFDFGNYSNDANVNTLIEPKNKGGIITLCMG